VAKIATNARSLEAWRSIQAVLPRMRVKVLTALAARPSICDELEVRLRMPHQTCSAVMNDLLRSGAIEPTGQRRRTRSGRFADVYQVRHAGPVQAQSALFDLGGGRP
jgi:hypothetical protein